MKKSFFNFLFLIIAHQLSGQSYNVVFQAEDSLNLSTGPILELYDETTLILVNASNCSTLPICTLVNSFYHIDKNGNILNINSLPYYICDIKVIDNEHFIALGFKHYIDNQSTGSYFLFSIVYNSNCQMMSKDSISINSNYFSSGGFTLINNKIYFYVKYNKYNYFSDYVIKTGLLEANYNFPDSLTGFEYHESSTIIGISDFLIANDQTMYFFAPYYGIIKYNPATQQITRKHFQKSDFVADYTALWVDSTTIIVGGSADNTPIGQVTHVQDFMILKTNLQFATIQALEIQKFPRYNFGGGVNCISKINNGYYYTGIMNRIESLDFSDSSFIYVAKMNDNLDLEWERQIGGSGIRRVNSLTTTKKGGCIVAASVYNNETGLWDINIIKFNSSGDYNNIVIPKQQNQIFIYPNPGSHGFYLHLISNWNDAVAEVYQPNGNKLLEKKITAKSNYIDMSGHPPGLYLVAVSQNGKNLFRQKWLKTE